MTRHLARVEMYVVLFSALLTLFLLLRPVDASLLPGIDDLVSIAGPALLLPLAFGRSSTSPSRLAVSRLFGLYVALSLLGDLLFFWYDQVVGMTPFPSLADAVYLAAYPVLFVGIVLVPETRLDPLRRTRWLVESLLLLIPVGTFSWAILLTPIDQQGGHSDLAGVIGLAYPLIDFLTVAAIVLLWLRTPPDPLRPALRLLTAGLLCTVIADSIFDYQELHQGYHTGELIDVLWPLGYLLVLLAARALRSIPPQAARRTPPRPESEDIALRRLAAPAPLWQELLPYPLAVALITTSVVSHALEVELGTGLFLVVLLLRQSLFLAENRQLDAQLRRAYAQAHDAAAALAQANRQLQALAAHDPVTELLNQRTAVAVLDDQLAYAQRFGHPCALLFLDLDHFKAINDQYGHLEGDAVLRQFGNMLGHLLRSVDQVGRWGGEEFVAILPETDAPAAQIVAERIRLAVETERFGTARQLHLTCSIGIAAFPEDGIERDTLIDRADQAMYAAKAAGRNRVQRAEAHGRRRSDRAPTPQAPPCQDTERETTEA